MNTKSLLFLRQFLAILGILAGILFISQRVNVFPLHDYLEYWSAGKINLEGGNPYSPEEMISLQRQIGRVQPDALMMWNPPWILALAMPFGMLNYSPSRMLWFLLELFILILTAELCWKIYNGEDRKRWIAWVFVLAFGPILHTLKLGQVTPLLLLGSVGFLFFIEKEKPFAAGALASLTLLKPHLMYLFIVALGLWILQTKSWKVLAGMAAGVILPLIISNLPNPQLIPQYFYTIQHYPPTDWLTATLGSLLRQVLGYDKFYLQFVPSILGLAWLLSYWLTHRKQWDWQTACPLVILVSAATTSYGWAHDVSIVTIAAVQIAALSISGKWTYQKTVIFSSFWIASLFSAFFSNYQNWFWWLSSFFLVWYLTAYAWLKTRQPAHAVPPSPGIQINPGESA
jgi:hypothetical protein